MQKITEKDSLYRDLEKMDLEEILEKINKEDSKVPEAVRETIPRIGILVNETLKRMKKGGRLFYIGAGTSGRLGIVDASEIPPTFGMPEGVVVGIMAGGDRAIRKAVEHAEDDEEQAWKDLSVYKIGTNDTLIGIAASGTTPYVIGGIKKARENGILTGCITCNRDSPLSKEAECPIEVIVGPEFVTGSTRMKSGTAQKLVLNMISTSLMIKLGRVKGNKMVNMQLTNNKLIERGTRMLMKELGIEEKEAGNLLERYGSVKKAMDSTERKS